MLHYDPQQLSSSTLLILRRTNFITTASGIVTLCKQPYSMQVESGLTVRSTTILNMFRAARCSSSGGQIVSPQPLVLSPSINSRTVCRWRAESQSALLRSSTCFEQHAAYPQEDKLYHHSLWYRHPL